MPENGVQIGVAGHVPAVVLARARNHEALMQTIDHSIEAAREARERAEAERAEREAEREAIDRSEGERLRRAAEVEEADARKLVEDRLVEAEREARQAELLGEGDIVVRPGDVDVIG